MHRARHRGIAAPPSKDTVVRLRFFANGRNDVEKTNRFPATRQAKTTTRPLGRRDELRCNQLAHNLGHVMRGNMRTIRQRGRGHRGVISDKRKLAHRPQCVFCGLRKMAHRKRLARNGRRTERSAILPSSQRKSPQAHHSVGGGAAPKSDAETFCQETDPHSCRSPARGC